jgi:hypothetical protein
MTHRTVGMVMTAEVNLASSVDGVVEVAGWLGYAIDDSRLPAAPGMTGY